MTLRKDATAREDSSLREELNGMTPRLRRYARALATGGAAPCDAADDLVHATLMRALAARHAGTLPDLLVRLYATVTQLNRELALSERQARQAGGGGASFAPDRGRPEARQTRLSAALLALPLDAREVLLLVGLEGFDYAEAARILRIPRGVLLGRLDQARTALDAALRSNVATAPAKSRVPHLRLVT